MHICKIWDISSVNQSILPLYSKMDLIDIHWMCYIHLSPLAMGCINLSRCNTFLNGNSSMKFHRNMSNYKVGTTIRQWACNSMWWLSRTCCAVGSRCSKNHVVNIRKCHLWRVWSHSQNLGWEWDGNEMSMKVIKYPYSRKKWWRHFQKMPWKPWTSD